MPVIKKFNKDFFKKWSSNMAYILGFLYADGNIVKTKRSTHFIAIYSSDSDLLYKIRQILDSDHRISLRRGSVYSLQIGSKDLFYDLYSIGLKPNKSRRMNLPSIPKKYIHGFIRGYFDGDGNVWSGYINRKRLKNNKVLFTAFTSASYDFLKQLYTLLNTIGLLGGSIYRIKDKECYRLQYSTYDSLKLYKIMYNKPYKLYLDRKIAVFNKFIENMRP